MPQALEDILVIDLSHALAGPYCSTLLADYGARVVKIEPPEHGDIARGWGTALPGGTSDYFASLHRNKQSMTLDLKNPAGREVLLDLLGHADVLIENYRVGAMRRMGLAWEDLATRFPRLVYCSVSGYGQDGPYSTRPAMDLIVQAESGMLSITGEQGGRGVRSGVSIADLTAGMNAALGVMFALHARARTGRGQQVDVSMLEGQLGLLNNLISSYSSSGALPERMGTAYKFAVPYQTFRTRTRELALAVGSEKLWKDFCDALGHAELTSDARFADNFQRVKHRQELIDTLQAIFLEDTYEVWEERLVAHGVPVGAVNDISQVITHPQVAARGALVNMSHPVSGSVQMTAPPIHLSDTPGQVGSPSPLLGEHTEQILQTVLGLDSSAIAALRKSGALGSPEHS